MSSCVSRGRGFLSRLQGKKKELISLEGKSLEIKKEKKGGKS